MNKAWHHVCVQVREDVWQALKETADRKGVSVSDVIRDAINAYLFVGFDSPPKTDIEQAEKAIMLILELLKRSLK